MPALLMRPHDLLHVRVDACCDAADEEPLTESVEVGDRLATQVARGSDDEPLKLHASESVPQQGFEDSQYLARPGLPAPDPIEGMSCRGEPGDECAVEVEERADMW